MSPSLPGGVPDYGSVSGNGAYPQPDELENSSRASSIIADADHLDDIEEDKDVYRMKVRQSYSFSYMITDNKLTITLLSSLKL